jgi:lactoylglutathione lyase
MAVRFAPPPLPTARLVVRLFRQTEFALLTNWHSGVACQGIDESELARSGARSILRCMKSLSALAPRATRLLPLLVLASLAVINQPRPLVAAEVATEFSKPVIDIGIVVGDTVKSVEFYTEAIGFKEVPGFKVSGERAAEIGLTDNQPADIRVFVLGEGNLATRIKLMSFPGVKAKMPDQKFIHSTLGVSYLTLYVTDMNVALKRLEKQNIKLLGKTPVDLGGGTYIAVVHDPDGNFIELVGPKKN